MGNPATGAAARTGCAGTDAKCCREFDEEPLGAMLCLCVPFSADDYAAERSATDLRASRGDGVWPVGAGMGKLGLGSAEKFFADLDSCRAAGDDAVLGDSQVAEALVVLVLDPDDDGSPVRGFRL